MAKLNKNLLNILVCPVSKGKLVYDEENNELVCEECCDLSHHRDHQNQILLLKAAASNFIVDVDKKLDNLV